MTEAEARTKWCPMIRSHAGNLDIGGGTTVNSFDESYVSPTCIAHECMMWRWLPAPCGAAQVPQPSEYGFCGLAGKPLV